MDETWHLITAFFKQLSLQTYVYALFCGLGLVLSMVGIALLLMSGSINSFLHTNTNQPGAVSVSKPSDLVVPAQSNTKQSDLTATAGSGDHQIQIWIEVSGAVERPGVYPASSEDRVGQILEQAGGLTDKADKNFVYQHINLAEKVTDGQKIFIPVVGQATNLPNTSQIDTNSATAMSVDTTTKPISINTASQSQLEELPGIGSKRAEDLIANRPFSDTYELVTKKVISENMFTELKNMISL